MLDPEKVAKHAYHVYVNSMTDNGIPYLERLDYDHMQQYFTNLISIAPKPIEWNQIHVTVKLKLRTYPKFRGLSKTDLWIAITKLKINKNRWTSKELQDLGL